MSADKPLSHVRATLIAALREESEEVDILARVCRTCVELLPVDGASISVMTGTQDRQTLYASDEVVSRIEMLQFSLGEGPCFEAFDTHQPVLVPDLTSATAVAWPVFATELRDLPVGAIFAFPLQSGTISIGAMDLYRERPGWLTPEELAIALEVVDVAALVLLGLQLDGVDGVDREWWVSLPSTRYQVHQATGMLIGAFGISAEQALARLRGYAFVTGRMVDEVAGDIVARRLAPDELES